jgi:ribosomal protein S27E
MRFRIPDKLRSSWIGVQCDECGKRYCISKRIMVEKKDNDYWTCPSCRLEATWKSMVIVVLGIFIITIYIVILSII